MSKNTAVLWMQAKNGDLGFVFSSCQLNSLISSTHNVKYSQNEN